MSNPEPVEIERHFAWSNMFVTPEDDPRSDGPSENSERAVLLDYLRDYRLTLQLKCADLSPEQHARHCGHADLLRECIDGRVGQ